MSDRRVNSPDRALETLLTNTQAELREVEKRTRWPGHSVVRRLTGPTAITNNLVAIWGPPPWPPTPDWTTLLTVDLDPGGWLITGSAAVGGTESTGSGFVWAPHLRLRVGADEALAHARSEVVSPVPGHQMRYNLSALLHVDSGSAPVTAILEAQVRSSSLDSADAYLARVVAVPA